MNEPVAESDPTLAALAELDASTPPPPAGQAITPTTLAARQRVRRARLALVAATGLLLAMAPIMTIWASALWSETNGSAAATQGPVEAATQAASPAASLARELDQLARRTERLLARVATPPTLPASLLQPTGAPVQQLRHQLAAARAEALPEYANSVQLRLTQSTSKTIR